MTTAETSKSFSCNAEEQNKMIERAARPIPLLWPLTNAIAANPLWDLRGHGFMQAAAIANEVLGIDGLPSASLFAQAYARGRITDSDLVAAMADLPTDMTTTAIDGAEGISPWRTVLEDHDWLFGNTLAAATDREVGKWCAAYLSDRIDAPQTAGFYRLWRSRVSADRMARRWGIGSGYPLAETAAEAINFALERLGVTGSDQVTELTAQLARCPGWAAHAKWRTFWAAPDHPGPHLTLSDYLAVRLSYDAAIYSEARKRITQGHSAPAVTYDTPPAEPLPEPANPALAARLAGLPVSAQRQVWLAAYELHYRDQFLAALDGRPGTTEPEVDYHRPAAQLVFCIDTRSEGLRRHIEAIGNYETFGFAGFFGIPARVEPFNSADQLDLFPVLLKPAIQVVQQPLDPASGAAVAAAAADLCAAKDVVGSAQKSGLSSYLLAEAGGFALGPAALARTLAPRASAAVSRWLRSWLTPDTDLTYVVSGPDAPSDDQQAAFAESALRGMGLTAKFARVVVLCGHGSTTTNNPYASALNCGACGAARGATSARLAAAVLNRPQVRSRLAAAGLSIPADTVFVAAEHDTATDTLTWFDSYAVPSSYRAELLQLREDLARAGRALATERARDLPGAAGRNPATHVATRSVDWAQTQPEWGLARNAAFLIAPRRESLGVDLGRRCFLHSYEPDADPDGGVLESILSGPMVVAHWINAAYYFSAVDPDVLGAGDKITHNAVGGIGVYQGAGGDLRLGLPLQSVFVNREELYHEPMRLLVAISAPRNRIDDLLGRNKILAELVNGSWIHLAARDENRWWLRHSERWAPWQPASSPTTFAAATDAR